MRTTLALAIVPLLAGFVSAQQRTETRTTTTTTRTSWDGALVDAACQTTRTERTEPGVGGVRTTTETTTRCPVTPATTTFGVLTKDGRFVRFDNPSNTRIVEVVRTNRAFQPSDRGPLWVTVTGAANGDLAVVETMDAGGSTVTIGQTERTERVVEQQQMDAMFDVTHDGDRGKLVLGADRVSFENVSNASKSRSWAYSEIKELKRDGEELKIEGYRGDSWEFKTQGRAMSDSIYNAVASRIVAARPR